MARSTFTSDRRNYGFANIPGYEAGRLIYAIVGGVLLLIGLFVLGGIFCDKLRSLFLHGAYAVSPPQKARRRDQAAI